MRKSPTQPAKPTDQYKRFVETARELACDEDEAAFDEKLRRIASVKPATPKPPRAKRIAEAKPKPKNGKP
jgi:hypothetical protein